MNVLPDDLAVVDPELKAGALLDRIVTDDRQHARRRERSFSAREALVCLEFEALLVAVAASNVAQGVELTDDDRARLWLASARISTITDEAVG